VRPHLEGPVSVVIVDDNDVIRSGLRSLLDTCDDVRVVGEAGDGDEAVALIRRLQPAVTLLDVRMPRRDGVAVAAEISSLTRVLMLTYGDAPDVVRAALAAGACGYLVHGTFRADQLVSAVLATAAGSSVFSQAATDVLREAVLAPPEPAVPVRPDVGLSPREVEVMELIAAGLTNAEISGRCFLSEKTVKNHVNHIFAKLGVRSRAEAVATWLGTAAPAREPGAVR
jgi:DNA-binding NarL/FixJ family response regulator